MNLHMDREPLWRAAPRDALASLVVFLVALPLCMGIAIASGAPVAAGLITGIIGGIVVGIIGGAPLQVSGPAAGLTVICVEIASKYGLAALALVVMLAGAIQLVAGLCKLGQWFRAVSPAVVHGMLSGIGVLIFSSQLHVMIDDRPRHGGLANLLSIPEAIAKGLPLPAAGDQTWPHSHDWAFMIGALSILIIMAWQSFAPARWRFIPGPLLAILLVTTIAWAGSLPILYVEIPDRLVNGLTPAWSVNMTEIAWPQLLFSAVFMAVIASAETLLCAGAVDRMSKGPATHYDRELAAQGFGNFLCGLVGGLPMTGVIVRSAANVQAGARTRLSAILHGTWLLLFVLCCGPLLRMIPTAALAGILVYTGFRLIGFHELVRLWKHERSEALIMLITIVVIVADDLLIGVLTGLGLSAFKLLLKFTRLEVRVIPAPNDDSTVTVSLAGAATFLRLPILAAQLEQVPHDVDVRIKINRLTYMDEACRDLFQTWIKQREEEGQCIDIDHRRLRAAQRDTVAETETVAWPPALQSKSPPA